MAELRETLCDGVYKTRDDRFYYSRGRDGFVLQYLSEDLRDEFVKINVVDRFHAEKIIDMIMVAES